MRTAVLVLTRCVLAQPEPLPADPDPIALRGAPVTRISVEPSAWFVAPGGDVRFPGGPGEARIRDLDLDSPRLSPLVEARAWADDWSAELSAFHIESGSRSATLSGLSLGPIAAQQPVVARSTFEHESIEAAASRRVHAFSSEAISVRVDAGAGLRLHHVDIEVSTPMGVARSDETFVAPQAGVYASVGLGAAFSFDVDASVAALPLSGHAMLDWDILAGFRWSPSPTFAAQIGYRQMAVLLDDGPSGNEFRWKGSSAGLYAGIVWRF